MCNKNVNTIIKPTIKNFHNLNLKFKAVDSKQKNTILFGRK